MGRLITFWNYVRRYKYWAALLIFLLILGVLDENSLWSRYERRVEISNLKREIAKYQQQYDEEKAQLQALESSREMVEKMARERYRMKRDNEDVFVFVNPGDGYVETTVPEQKAPVAKAPAATAVPDTNARSTDSTALTATEEAPATFPAEPTSKPQTHD